MTTTYKIKGLIGTEFELIEPGIKVGPSCYNNFMDAFNGPENPLLLSESIIIRIKYSSILRDFIQSHQNQFDIYCNDYTVTLYKPRINKKLTSKKDNILTLNITSFALCYNMF